MLILLIQNEKYSIYLYIEALFMYYYILHLFIMTHIESDKLVYIDKLNIIKVIYYFKRECSIYSFIA